MTNDWIASVERLPDPHTRVLVWNPWGPMQVLYIEIVHGFVSGTHERVSHPSWYPGGASIERSYWRPLPTPPE